MSSSETLPPSLSSSVKLKPTSPTETEVYDNRVLIGKVVKQSDGTWLAVLLRIAPRSGKIFQSKVTPSVLVNPFQTQVEAARALFLYNNR